MLSLRMSLDNHLKRHFTAYKRFSVQYSKFARLETTKTSVWQAHTRVSEFCFFFFLRLNSRNFYTPTHFAVLIGRLFRRALLTSERAAINRIFNYMLMKSRVYLLYVYIVFFIRTFLYIPMYSITARSVSDRADKTYIYIAVDDVTNGLCQ